MRRNCVDSAYVHLVLSIYQVFVKQLLLSTWCYFNCNAFMPYTILLTINYCLCVSCMQLFLAVVKYWLNPLEYSLLLSHLFLTNFSLFFSPHSDSFFLSLSPSLIVCPEAGWRSLTC